MAARPGEPATSGEAPRDRHRLIRSQPLPLPWAQPAHSGDSPQSGSIPRRDQPAACWQSDGIGLRPSRGAAARAAGTGRRRSLASPASRPHRLAAPCSPLQCVTEGAAAATGPAADLGAVSLSPHVEGRVYLLRNFICGAARGAQRFGACLWPGARSWRPGIESHAGLPAWSRLLPLPVSLPLSLSLSLCLS